MATIIVYASRHGCTAEAAQTLAGMLEKPVTLCDLKKKKPADLGSFDTVVIGGSIHAGRIQGIVRDFCLRNSEILSAKRLGLFLSCMEQGEKAEQEFADAFPETLRRHASALGLFGGRFVFARMNFLERAIVKKVAKVNADVDRTDQEAIRKFAAALSGK